MPMSTSKFQARTRTRAFEQRAVAKARLLKDPPKPPRRCRQRPSNITYGGTNALTYTVTNPGQPMDLGVYGAGGGGGAGDGYAAGGIGGGGGGIGVGGAGGGGEALITTGGYAQPFRFTAGGQYYLNDVPATQTEFHAAYTRWQYEAQYNTYNPIWQTQSVTSYTTPYYINPVPMQARVYLRDLIPTMTTTYTPVQYDVGAFQMPITIDAENAWGQWNHIGVAAQGAATSIADLNNALASVESAWTKWNDEWTPSQRRALERENANRRNHANQLQDNQRRSRVKAEERALGIFLHTLTDEQRETYDKEKCIYVNGSRGRRYRIRCAGQSGNVEWLGEDGQLRGKLCAHPRGYVPNPDAWLAQKLILMTDEDHFNGTANVHQGARPELVRV